MEFVSAIRLEGVRVNNLQNITLEIPHQKLVVFCGLSGSGKSSLAFDTLFAEGQRRYVETFAPSVRQFLQRTERPAADRISGLPPAVAVQQRPGSSAPTTTIAQRLGLQERFQALFARRSLPWCPNCHVPIQLETAESALKQVLADAADCRLLVAVAPRDVSATGSAAVGDPQSPADWLRQGLTRCLIDGDFCRVEDVESFGQHPHALVVIDRLHVMPSHQQRILEAAALATQLAGEGVFIAETKTPITGDTIPVSGAGWSSWRFAEIRSCPNCRLEIPALTPQLFSRTSPIGACPTCSGSGLLPQKKTGTQRDRHNQRRQSCESCGGGGLNPIAAAARYRNLSMSEFNALELAQLALLLDDESGPAAQLPAPETLLFGDLRKRLDLLHRCGLSYLSAGRTIATLSTGEARRVELAAAISSGLTGTLYVLDEPAQGLHKEERETIVSLLTSLRDAGNSVVVVEHDRRILSAADLIVELGPAAGAEGGRIVFAGTPEELRNADTATAVALRATEFGTSAFPGNEREAAGRERREPNGWLEFTQIHSHNIAGLDLKIPLGVFCVITGVSGSGKSSLLSNAVFPLLNEKLHGAPATSHSTGSIQEVNGIQNLDSVLMMDHRPVKASLRSIPATFMGIFADIRRLLAETHEARKRNWSAAVFSFNAVAGGRCPDCRGRGAITVSMQFLADIESRCETCSGTRFRSDITEVRFRDRSIAEILEMSADEAFRFFSNQHRIQMRLNAMRQAGLGYLRLNQPLSVLSGGESQRLKIAATLAGISRERRTTETETSGPGPVRGGRTLFCFDEPSGGLHAADIARLADCLNFLLSSGHSVVVIDHDDALRRHADWEICMGPGPGSRGGRVVSSGPPA